MIRASLLRNAGAGAVWIAPALLAGLLLGGWSPRVELRRLRGELESARARHNRTPASTIDTLSRIVGAGASLPADRAEPPVREERRTPDADDADTPARQASSDDARTESRDETPAPRRRADLRQRVETAAEVWALRAEVAREGFVSRAELDAEQAAQFDVLVEAMNLRMHTQMQELADFLGRGETLTPEDGVRIIHALTGILTLTYDEMDRTLSPEWREPAGPEFDLGQFVDPMVAEPLFDVERELQQSRPPRAWRRGGRVGP